MHLLILLKSALLLLTSKTVDCSIAGLTYMNPIKQISCTGPYSPHCGSSNALYWYPRPTSNLHKIQYHQPWPVPPRLVPPLPYSSSTQPPPLLCQPFSPPTPCPTIPTFCLLPLCPSTSTNSSTPKSDNSSTTQPSTSPTTVYTSTVAPAALPILPLISNAIPQIPLQSFPIFSPSFHVPLVPQILPELPGLVSKDGGINIMPFSDIYTDLYEKFKDKVARKELKKLARNKKIRKYLLEIVSLEESEDLSSLSSSDTDESLEKSREIGN